MPVSISGTNGVTFPDSSLQAAAASPFVLKNRIINGDMRIDQRYAGTATPNTINNYVVDRWQVNQSTTGKLIAQQNAGSVTPPAGFSNYLGATSQSAYSVGASDYYLFQQPIEGFNVADLAWGTADAKTVTISFWARSSLTGTFGGVISNSDANRSYPFTYTITAANTWEKETITIPGDTSGTWFKTNGVGMFVRFGLGVGSTYNGTAGAWAGAVYLGATGATSVVGTNGATFYITGVQLEQNTSATPFERRLYGQELALCQRYFAKTFPQSVAVGQNSGDFNSLYNIAQVNNLSFASVWKLPVTMRANPTITTFSPNAANANWSPNATTPTAVVATASQELAVINGTTSTTAGNGYYIHASASIEL
jgi:hypothetical protein